MLSPRRPSYVPLRRAGYTSPSRGAVPLDCSLACWLRNLYVVPSAGIVSTSIGWMSGVSLPPIPEDQVHRIRGEADPEREAKDYCWLVGSELPFDGEYPVFDIVLLGLGDDGHTSSIFPHEPQLLTEEAPYAVATSPKGQRRIALTGPTILAARRLLFLVTGEAKAPVLRAILSSSPEAKGYPAAYIAEHRPDVALYTDVVL